MPGQEELIVEQSTLPTIDQSVKKSMDSTVEEPLPLVDPEALLKRLHHIQVLLKRALKRAKTFTIQKSLKRTKKNEEYDLLRTSESD